MANVHICALQARTVKDLLKGRNRLTDQFTCGGCLKTFETVCVLHGHCMKHNGGGSYFFDHVTCTAYPKYDTHCSYTQVSDSDFNKPDGKEMLAHPRDISTTGHEKETEWGKFEDLEDEQNDSDSVREDTKGFDELEKSIENRDEENADNINESIMNNDSDDLDDEVGVVDGKEGGVSEDMGVVEGKEGGVSEDMGVIGGEVAGVQDVEGTVVTVKNIGKADDGSITFEMNENDTHLFDATASAIMDRVSMMGDDWIDDHGMELQIVVQHDSRHHTDTEEKSVKTEDIGQDGEQRLDNKRAVDNCSRDNTSDGKSGIDNTGGSGIDNGAFGIGITGLVQKSHSLKMELGNDLQASADNINKSDSVNSKGKDNVKEEDVSLGLTESDRVSESQVLDIQRVTEAMTSSRRSMRKRKPNTRLMDSEWDTPTKKVKSDQNDTSKIKQVLDTKQVDGTAKVPNKFHDVSNCADISASEVLLSLSETNTDGTDIDEEPSKRRLRKQKRDVESNPDTKLIERVKKQKRVDVHETDTDTRMLERTKKQTKADDNETVALQSEERSEVTDSTTDVHEGTGDMKGSVKTLEKGKERIHKKSLVPVEKPNTREDKKYIESEEEIPEDMAEDSVQTEIVVEDLKSKDQKTRRRKRKVGTSDAKRKDHVCKVCGKTGTLAMVAYHKQIHSSDMPYTCEVCGKGFKTRPCFKAHARQHGEKGYQCQLCPAAFFRNQYLVSHMRSHTGETPFVCDLCGSRFKEFYILQRHINNVHRQERNFQCDVCHEKFFRVDTRDKHRLRHFPPTLKCSFCTKMFKGELDRRKHELTHTGEKQVFCPLCRQGFAQLWPYYRHMWKKHNIQKDEAKEMRIKNPDLVFMRNKNFVYSAETGDDADNSGTQSEDRKVTVFTLSTDTGSSATHRIDAPDGDVGGSDGLGGDDADAEILGEGDLEGYQRLVVSTHDGTVEQLMGRVDDAGPGMCGAAGDTGLELDTEGITVVQAGEAPVLGVDGIQALVDSQGDRNVAVTLHEENVYLVVND